MTAVVLDAEALSLLARGGPGEATVRAALAAALAEQADTVVPAAVLAELYRGGPHDQAVDGCLAREGGIDVVDTDRRLARRIGNLLGHHRLGSEHHVDATVVATAVHRGGGMVVTGDADDLDRLAADLPHVTVHPIAQRRLRRR